MARLHARDDHQGRDPNHRLQTVTLNSFAIGVALDCKESFSRELY